MLDGELGKLGEPGELGELGKLGELGEPGELGELGKMGDKISIAHYPIAYCLTNDEGQISDLGHIYYKILSRFLSVDLTA